MKNLILCFCLSLIPFSSARADWIMLTNGDRLSGQIIAQDRGSLTMNSDIAGQITLPRDRVASIHTGDAPRVLARELRTGEPMAAPVPESTPAIPASMPESGQNDERTNGSAKKDGYEWSGIVSAGGTLQDGNSKSKSVTGQADVTARDEKNRFALGGQVNWAEDEGTRTDNDQKIYGEYDRFLNEKWFVGGRQSFERDEFEELDLRSKTGLFLGHQFYERDDLNLQVKAGPEYIYEKFESGDTENDIALAWGLKYDQKVWEDALTVFHNHSLSMPVSATDAFLFDSETGARVPIGEHLNASAQVDFDWDNDPAPGVQESDTTYALKVGYEW